MNVSSLHRPVGHGLLVIGIVVLSMGVAPPSTAQTPKAIVMEQVRAFNEGRLDDFLAFYDDDSTYRYFWSDTSLVDQGKRAIRERFAYLDSTPEAYGVDADCFASGIFVTCHERLRTDPDMSFAAVYEVRDRRIHTVWVYYAQPAQQGGNDMLE